MEPPFSRKRGYESESRNPSCRLVWDDILTHFSHLGVFQIACYKFLTFDVTVGPGRVSCNKPTTWKRMAPIIATPVIYPLGGGGGCVRPHFPGGDHGSGGLAVPFLRFL